MVDATSPIKPQIDTNGYTPGKMTNQNVTLTVSGSEALSGIKKYQYSTDDGLSWTDMAITDDSASIVVSDETDGTSYIFRAVSNSGVEGEVTDPVTVKIDKEAPTITYVGWETDGTGSSFAEQVNEDVIFTAADWMNIILSAQDSSSGVKSITYQLTNGEEQTVVPDADGNYTFRLDKDFLGQLKNVYATDEAGNRSEVKAYNFFVLEVTPPNAPVVDTGSYNGGEWTNNSVTLSPLGSSSISGIDRYEYSTDGGKSWNRMPAELITLTENTSDIAYLFRAVSNAGKTSETASVTVKIDKTAPDGDIKFEGNSVKESISNITFGLFFKENIDVDIIGTDALSGVAKIEYYRSDKALMEDEIKAITDWTPTNGTFSVTAEDQVKFIYYVKITDKAGNVAYFGSEGAAFDLTAPVINGVMDGGTYYVTQEVTVSDENLNSMTLNGKPASGSLILEGNIDATYTIVATDKAGNVTEYAVTMKPIEVLADPISDLTAGNVTSNDQQTVQAVKTEIQAIHTGNATEDEKTALGEIADRCDELLEKIKEVAKIIEDIETRFDDVTIQTVTPDNEPELEQLKEDIEQVLTDYDGNLTENEKSKLGEYLKAIQEMLDSLKKVEEIQNDIESLPDTVEPDDMNAEQLVKEAKKEYDALTEHEKSLVREEAREKLESLLAALGDYKIVKGDGSKWEKGTQTGLSFTANGAYAKFTGIKVDGKAVDKDNYTAVSGSTVIVLKAEYLQSLSAGKHTLTVQYTDGEASCGFEVFAKDATATPETGDSSNIPLWIILLFMSGSVLSLVTYRKKRQLR